MDFNSLDLPEPVLRGVREAGFVTATPIQEGALPLAQATVMSRLPSSWRCHSGLPPMGVRSL